MNIQSNSLFKEQTRNIDFYSEDDFNIWELFDIWILDINTKTLINDFVIEFTIS